MWYKLAQGFGGGILSPVDFKIQQALSTSAQNVENPAQIIASEPSSNLDGENKQPMNESPADYEKRLWDSLVNRSDSIASDGDLNIKGPSAGPAIEAEEARRLSPYHKNPEETTMEEQLEALRQENVNGYPETEQSMSSTEGGRGEQRVRGEFPYASGKGWTGYEDLPSNKSWA